MDNLADLIAGSREQRSLGKRLLETYTGILYSDSKPHAELNIYDTREEIFERAWRVTRAMVMTATLHKCDADQLSYLRILIGENLPVTLHDAVFMPALRTQASDEQLEQLLPLAENYKILGCYCQTELGHGSNVWGIETTATYDAGAQCFHLNSGPVSATKWWVGALGMTSSHAIVFARLLSGGEDYGVQSFLVQLRDEEHKLLPGIETGDIGPKLGFAEIDNGYARFNNVTLPSSSLLCRYVTISPDGTVTKRGHPKIGYAGMMTVRVAIVRYAFRALATAVTVALRYTARRRQFAAPQHLAPGSGRGEAGGGRSQECAVLDYQAVQGRLLPLLTTAYCYRLVTDAVGEANLLLQREVAGGDVHRLGSYHALVAGLKSHMTDFTAAGIEACRRSCGGHGYSLLGGLSQLYCMYVHIVTAEGENHVMAQQVGRYLMRSAMMGQEGLVEACGSDQDQDISVSHANYLVEPECAALLMDGLPSGGIPCVWSAAVEAAKLGGMGLLTRLEEMEEALVTGWEDLLRAALTVIAHTVCVLLHRLQSRAMEEGVSPDQAFGAMHEDMDDLCLLHSNHVLLRLVANRVRGVGVTGSYTSLLQFAPTLTTDPATGRIQEPVRGTVKVEPDTHRLLHLITACHSVFVLHNCSRLASALGVLKPEAIATLQTVRLACLRTLRPRADVLVDAFDIPDVMLRSALGSLSQDPYETMLDIARTGPLNQTVYQTRVASEYIRPLMRGDFSDPSKIGPSSKL